MEFSLVVVQTIWRRMTVTVNNEPECMRKEAAMA
jgi:hypothetical protein